MDVLISSIRSMALEINKPLKFVANKSAFKKVEVYISALFKCICSVVQYPVRTKRI